jgi:hypothetical protein
MAKSPTPKDPGTAIISWEDELAKHAEVAVAMEASAGGGGFFSIRGGILTLNDVQIPENQMAVVILDSILENVYYDSNYDASAVSPPKCFAFGRDEATMKPHDVVTMREQEENAVCNGCAKNEWGSADRGRGKACSNRRRLSLISAGDINVARRFEPYTTDHFETSPVALLKLPVTSVKLFANYVKQIANVMKRPPFGVITLIKVVPDPKTQVKVIASYIDKVPDHLLPSIMRRREETQSQLEQPYVLDFDDAPVTPIRGTKARGSKF